MVAVFSYGSNLCVERIRERVASAEPRHVGYLESHALRFHKRGRDGSAKADAFATGDPADRVWGVIYELSDADKPVLDRYEGLGRGYADREIEIVTVPGPRVAAFMYQAQSEHIDASLLPYTWYRDFVIIGAGQHGLPSGYIDAVRAVDVAEDPDPERHRRETSIVIAGPAR